MYVFECVPHLQCKKKPNATSVLKKWWGGVSHFVNIDNSIKYFIFRLNNIFISCLLFNSTCSSTFRHYFITPRLRVSVTSFFDPQFFRQSITPRPQNNILKYFRILVRISWSTFIGKITTIFENILGHDEIV
jgi:hypothetical protein